MRKILLINLLVLLSAIQSYSFCGFYVAKADAQLFNRASAVILARDGTQVAITMSNDFEGEVKDFAMVVPVPVVLKRSQIRLVDPAIFDKLDAYSGPRLVEYHDQNPCQPIIMLDEVQTTSANRPTGRSRKKVRSARKDYGVTIVESYTIGEYDILILSAKESDGLQSWLTQNGYKIPPKAADVLEPYIKSNMKFFVVKVNLENFKSRGVQKLRPLQMTFRSDRFMLPIRLGMANAKADQDLIVYAFSKQGRIETTNYRTRKIPTNAHIPLAVQPEFGKFYQAVFQKSWEKSGKNGVMLEYAWDLSSSNFVKCDPCPTQPPTYAELREAGIFWATANTQGRRRGGADYQAEVFMTRLHIRYNRETFPQDLQFQETPNRKSFQGRYILTRPAQGDLSCPEGQEYLSELREKRRKEVKTLAKLTGWSNNAYQDYIHEFDDQIEENGYLGPLPEEDRGLALPIGDPHFPLGPWLMAVLALGLLALLWIAYHRKSLKLGLTSLAIIGLALPTYSFCGFYVAKADAQLFNQKSAVIVARQGNQTVVTMSSDFEGDVKDFAMVIPVPEVLKRSQIRLAEASIFDKLDAYSGPRLVEYHDAAPCEDRRYREIMSAAPVMAEDFAEEEPEMDGGADDLGVQIIERYTVGEYDILILSAEESSGLQTWLTRNGYRIPPNAASVLAPYIKSDLKFFVVKVNLENFKRQGKEQLRPIQMSFRSDRFMLPIRLGMANAKGDQDMIVYAFSDQGRIETTNYRTVEIPSNQDIPLFVQERFGEFYVDLYKTAWQRAGRNAVMLEYAWDLSSTNFVKCDPCITLPPKYTELREAGVFWATAQGNFGGANYQGQIFMTRLHVRYNRHTFPQDLRFQVTPNRQNFQGRYVMRHPATGDLSCDAGQQYLQQLIQRRERELQNLARLTGWNVQAHRNYVDQYRRQYDNLRYLGPLPEKEHDKGGFGPFTGSGSGGNFWMIIILTMLWVAAIAFIWSWYRYSRMKLG